MMTIQITHQHLSGNDPESLNVSAWLAALESEYRQITEAHYPGAEVHVDLDVQSAGGASRGTSVYVDNAPAPRDFEASIVGAANQLWDAHSSDAEFWD